MEHIITNYIYLLHEREHIRLSENVYKVGMTRQLNLERFHNYPKGSILLFQMECIDCKFIESIVLQEFKDRFDKCCFYGNEYFQGNKKDMMKIIYLIIANEYKIRECTRDRRSNYIDSILKEHHIVDKVTTPVTNDRKPHPFLSCAINRGTPNTRPINNNERLFRNKHANTNPYKCPDLPHSSVVMDQESDITDEKYNPPLFSCEICNIYTANRSDYKKHIRTKKHIKLTKNCVSTVDENTSNDDDDDNDDDATTKNDFGLNISNISTTTERTYNGFDNATEINSSYNKNQICKYCGVGYSYSSGLSRHMKECKSRVEVGDNNTSSTATVENVKITDMISIIHKLIEENRELMKLMTYAMKSNQEVINNMLETFTKIKAGPVTNNIYN